MTFEYTPNLVSIRRASKRISAKGATKLNKEGYVSSTQVVASFHSIGIPADHNVVHSHMEKTYKPHPTEKKYFKIFEETSENNMNYINILQEKTKEDATKDIFSVLSARALDVLDEARETLSEVSKATLGSYIKKASVDAKFSGYKAGYNDADATAHAKGSMYKRMGAGTEAATYDDNQAHKRLKAVGKAVDKLAAKIKEGTDDSSSKMILEYSAKGTVDGKQFNIACNDAYDEASVAAQNPHLKLHHVKAIVDHTESDAFMDDQEAHTHQNGLEVHSVSDGYQGDFDETKDQIEKMTGK
jgi:hypothetical protein